jgi:hypothetical protein
MKTMPEFKIHSVIDILVFAEENRSYIEMGMTAAKEGYDRHVSSGVDPIELVKNMGSNYLFFKSEQISKLGFENQEDYEMFSYYLSHDWSEYYYDPEDKEQEWDDDRYFMIRKSDTELYWLHVADVADSENIAYLIKIQVK